MESQVSLNQAHPEIAVCTLETPLATNTFYSILGVFISFEYRKYVLDGIVLFALQCDTPNFKYFYHIISQNTKQKSRPYL